MAIDLTQYAVGGATRPDTFTGLDPAFLQSLQAMIAAAPPEIQQNLKILSGFRSPERQAQLWEEALQKYGSPEVARKWVAPPGRSFHNKGQAVDLRYLDDSARAWAHENAANYGLHFPLSNEPWHIEPLGTRGGGGHRHAANPPVPASAGGGEAPPAAAGFVAPAAGQGPEKGGGLGALFASLAPAAGGLSGGPGLEGPVAEGPTPVGDPLAATMAAMQGAERARGLRGAMMPDLEGLMGLGKRRV